MTHEERKERAYAHIGVQIYMKDMYKAIETMNCHETPDEPNILIENVMVECYMAGYHKMEMEEKIGDALLIFHQKAVEAFRDTIRLVSIRDEHTYSELESIFAKKLVR